MSSVWVAGLGAVSPAGWTVDALRQALDLEQPMPVKDLPRPGWTRSLQVRAVPAPATRPDFLNHARLRRTSPISQFAVAAALQALGADLPRIRAGSLRLGVLVSVMAGCVNYSRRFYDETLRDPATASPLLFPETVFNAPASHLAAFLGSSEISYTLVGDPGMFLVALAAAANWLRAGTIDACLVVGAEELDWMVADAAHRFQRRTILSEGAGALYLRAQADRDIGIELAAVTDSHSFLQSQTRLQAAAAMRAQLPATVAGQLLCDGLQGLPGLDAPERTAWSDWLGSRISPKLVLGEGFAAASAWQCVAAVEALWQKRHPAACVSVVGCNQQAIGACFRRR